MNNKEIKELTSDDLRDVTWSNINLEILGKYKDKIVRTSNFLAIVDDIHPFYLREVNISEGWATAAIPVKEPEPFDESTVGTLSEFYNLIRECGVEIKDEEIKIVRHEFTDAKIKVFEEDMEEDIATIFRHINKDGIGMSFQGKIEEINGVKVVTDITNLLSCDILPKNND